ncbi:MAG: nucleoside-diphosphate sugar epimerase/dehydratase [Erythrobacter sp.]
MLSALVRCLGIAAGLPRRAKQLCVVAIDVAMLFASAWFAYSLRTDQFAPINYPILAFCLGAIIVMLPTFYATKVYSVIFRYSGVGTLRTVLNAFVLYGILIAAIFTIYSFARIPRTMGLLQPILFFIMVAGSRMVIRALLVDVLERRRFDGERRRVLIYGSGRSGQQLARSMRNDPQFHLIGYLDDDGRLYGQQLDGLPVFNPQDTGDVVEQRRVTDILFAIPSASRSRRRKILQSLERFNVVVQTLPSLSDMVEGNVSFNDIRPLEIHDLLGREPIQPNELLLGRNTVGKTVLVTGAGGSIGSELCRQIVAIGARKLILFEVSEYALYSIHQELSKVVETSERAKTQLVPVLDCVTSRERLDRIFASEQVDTIYHAAAYKHVPLVEANPIAAMRNNIVGTKVLVETAMRGRVSNFILISTDKAVRPTNIMGASKRAAEQIIQAHANGEGKDSQSVTKFSMVRFGNVLGSSGSVVPLFREQIERGGPITLTHRDITRYFMTIPEAANLVIQAGGMAQGGEVFVLDMGKPVKIYELARMMVQLSGLTLRAADKPDGDIAIEEVGLRPGEKLYEELLIGENPEKTSHPRIMKAHEGHIEWQRLSGLVEQLAACKDPAGVAPILKQIVPEFEHKRDEQAA